VQVYVDDRQYAAVDLEFDEQKPLFTDASLAEHDGFGGADGVAGEEGVAVAEIEESAAPVGDAEYGVGEAGVDAEVVEVVEVAGPAGAFVDFLQAREVGRESIEEVRDPAQVGAEFPRSGGALDRIQPAPVCDVESHEAQPRHSCNVAAEPGVAKRKSRKGGRLGRWEDR
jgi:hypothetical protein